MGGPGDDKGGPGDAATLAGTSAGPSVGPEQAPARPRVRGGLVGRYILLDELGAGAMGVVWAAYDPELDRRVALKLLVRSDHSERLLREAQALARLAHPNVVAVFDAGVDDREVWLAMELVTGLTLKSWLKEHDPAPGWREVLAALIPAGRGVAAAHAAGLIHRDLKPDNLMVGADGRVRVMDFGLARAGETLEAASPDPAVDLLGSRTSLLSSDVTRTGAILGTPAYMAPEQLRGRADERSDLFSLCVVLWEALHGARPFGGETVAAVVLAISRGQFQAPPRGRRTPRWLRRILARGLAPRPEDRWPHVGHLLDALERGQVRHRRERWLLAALGLALVAAATLGALTFSRARQVAACRAEGDAIAALWPGRAGAVVAGIAGSGLSFAASTQVRLAPLLDAWAQRWADERAEACVAATVSGGFSPALRERADFCLDAQRAGAELLLERLAAGERGAIVQAVPGAAQLASSRSCVERERLERGVWPTSEQWPAVRELREQIARTKLLVLVGAYDDARARARELRGAAERLGWPPVLAEVEHLIGRIDIKQSRDREGEAPLRAAFFGAGRAGDDALALTAATDLVLLVGERLGRPSEGLEWGEHASMLLARLGEEDELPAADLLRILAVVHQSAGSLDQALALAERSLALRLAKHGPETLETARAHSALGLILRSLGRNAEGTPHLERTLQIQEAIQGPDHPEIAGALNNLALTRMSAGEIPAALALYERALALHEAVGEGESPTIATALTNVSTIYLRLDRFADAIAAGERALAIRTRALGRDAPLVASSLNNLGIAYLAAGQPQRALELHQEALAIREARLGPEHPDVARSLTNIAETQLKLGAPSLALPLLERAEAIRVAKKVGPQDLAYTRYVLARALAASGQSGRARELAAASAEIFRAAGDPRVADVDKLLVELAAAPARPKRRTTRRKKTP